MATYAAETKVPVGRSRDEIEKTLTRYGADQFVYGWSEDGAAVGFRIGGRMIRMLVPMPAKNDRTITHTDGGARRSESAAQAAYEQAQRQRWRAMALVVKAKLEAVQSGIATIEQEFLAWTMLPDGSTVGDWMEPQIRTAYETGAMPAALPGLEQLALNASGK